MKRSILQMSVLCVTLVLFGRAFSAPATQPDAKLVLDLIQEEGQKLIHATLTVNGKPVENAVITFGVKRTFGVLALGEDKTLDDGTAAMKFPLDIPGGPRGIVDVVAAVKSPADLAAIRCEKRFDGVRVVPLVVEALPRALWARQAPLSLLIPIVVLLAGVWSAYVFVVFQVIAIRRGAQK